jgi:hypothetical protein
VVDIGCRIESKMQIRETLSKRDKRAVQNIIDSAGAFFSNSFLTAGLPLSTHIITSTANDMSRLLLWCYGSLQQGHLRGWILQDAIRRSQAVYCGAYRLITPHPLLLRPPNHVPALCDSPGTGHCVRGELYEIEQRAFGFLHENMTYRRGLYFPKLVAVEPISTSAARNSSAVNAVHAITFMLTPKKAAAALQTAAAFFDVNIY